MGALVREERRMATDSPGAACSSALFQGAPLIGRLLPSVSGRCPKRPLSGATTKAIAREAGCSEGAIYVHFEDRTALLLAVLEETLTEMKGPLGRLEGKAGEATVRAALRGMYAFHERAIPLLGGLFADAALLEAFRGSLEASGKGPHLALRTLTRYLERERALGRVSPDSGRGLSRAGPDRRVLLSGFYGGPFGRFLAISSRAEGVDRPRCRAGRARKTDSMGGGGGRPDTRSLQCQAVSAAWMRRATSASSR